MVIEAERETERELTLGGWRKTTAANFQMAALL